MRRRPTAVISTLLLLCAAATARAGGGPENVLLVVNADSPTSLQVANHYVKLRGIPSSHICTVRGLPNLTVIGIDVFRERIWKPIREHLESHGLIEEIDIIAYSADFPFGVDFGSEFKDVQLPQLMDKFRTASLTGLTYLIQLASEGSREWLDMKPNNYWRWNDYGELLPGHGFRSRYVWTLGDERPKSREEEPDQPYRYYLSTVLGFTGTQGNTLPEVLTCLERAAASDGTRPEGTVYLMKSTDVRRSGPRAAQFPRVIERLAGLGRKAVVLEAGAEGQDGKLPQGKDDVMGCVAGVAGFHWGSCGSGFLPGAIAEHLTSFGGRFDGSGQTKISEFIRAGAAGSSGSVAEPYNHPFKFPAASLHVHYAEGCNLAESFYQSFATPYQMIVIGDPLARPYAHFAQVTLVEPSPKTTWSGTVALHVQVKPAEGKAVRTVELWVDGQRLAGAAPGEPLTLDTTTRLDGEHELRLVAVEDSLVATQSSAVVRVSIANGSSRVTIKGPRKHEAWGARLKLSGRASKAETVIVRHGLRTVATVRPRGSTWKAEVDTKLLGPGALTLQALATWKDGSQAVSEFLDVEVLEPAEAKRPRRRTPRRKPKDAPSDAAGRKTRGLQATVQDAQGKEYTFRATSLSGDGKARFLKELHTHVKGSVASIRLLGEFEVKQDGLYRFALSADGTLALKVAGADLLRGEDVTTDRQVYTACFLSTGWHAIELEYEPRGSGELGVWLGGAQVHSPLEGQGLRH